MEEPTPPKAKGPGGGVKTEVVTPKKKGNDKESGKFSRFLEAEVKRLKGELAETRRKLEELKTELGQKEEKIGKQDEQLNEAAEIMVDQQKAVEKLEEKWRKLKRTWEVVGKELEQHFGGDCGNKGIRRRLEKVQGILKDEEEMEVEVAKVGGSKKEEEETTEEEMKNEERHEVDNGRKEEGCFCVCGLEYSSRSNLNIHIKCKTLGSKFKCQLCDKRFAFLCFLTRHEASIHGIKKDDQSPRSSFGCSECGKRFGKYVNLAHHRKLKHSVDNLGSSEPKPEILELPPERQNSEEPVEQMEEEEDDDEIQFIEEKPTDVKPFAVTPSSSRGFELSSVAMSFAKVKSSSPLKVKPVLGSGKSGSSSKIEETKPAANTPPEEDDEKVEVTLTLPVPAEHRELVQTEESDAKKRKKGRKKRTQKFLASLKHGISLKNPRRCLCGFSSYYKMHVKRHVEKMAKAAALKASGQSNPNAKWECQQCGEAFKDKWKMTNHSKLHTRKLTDFKCTVCGFKVSTRLGLSSHMRKHNKPQPQVVQVQVTPKAKVLQQKSKKKIKPKLKKGKPKHAVDESRGDQEFYCCCGRQFDQKGQLDSHVKYNNLKKRFTCTLCPYKCRAVAILKSHLQRAHKVTGLAFSIGCLECGMVFETREQHRKHQMSAHGTLFGGKRKADKESEEVADLEEPPVSPQPIPIAIPIYEDDF